MESRLLHSVTSSRALLSKPIIISLLALMAVLLFATSGCVREEDISLEQRAHQLFGELMCPVCDGQTITGSNAQIARDMRVKVEELLQEGQTNAEIKDYFVIRYGEEILAAPKGEGFNLLAWMVPVIIVIIGIAIALLTIKSLHRSGTRDALTAASATTPADPGGSDLSDYLAQVDRDLGIPDQPDAPDEEPKQSESSPEVDS